jgi:hypothetical protein
MSGLTSESTIPTKTGPDSPVVAGPDVLVFVRFGFAALVTNFLNIREELDQFP